MSEGARGVRGGQWRGPRMRDGVVRGAVDRAYGTAVRYRHGGG